MYKYCTNIMIKNKFQKRVYLLLKSRSAGFMRVLNINSVQYSLIDVGYCYVVLIM